MVGLNDNKKKASSEPTDALEGYSALKNNYDN